MFEQDISSACLSWLLSSYVSSACRSWGCPSACCPCTVLNCSAKTGRCSAEVLTPCCFLLGLLSWSLYSAPKSCFSEQGKKNIRYNGSWSLSSTFQKRPGWSASGCRWRAPSSFQPLTCSRSGYSVGGKCAFCPGFRSRVWTRARFLSRIRRSSLIVPILSLLLKLRESNWHLTKNETGLFQWSNSKCFLCQLVSELPCYCSAILAEASCPIFPQKEGWSWTEEHSELPMEEFPARKVSGLRSKTDWPKSIPQKSFQTLPRCFLLSMLGS